MERYQKQMIAEGSQVGLSEEFIEKVYSAIHQESISHQHNIAK